MKKMSMDKEAYALANEYNLADLQSMLQYVEYEKGEAIYTQEAACTKFVFVVSGRATVSSHSLDGKTVTFFDYISKGMMGESEFMAKSAQAAATVVALSNFRCLEFPYAGNEKRLKQNPAFMTKVAESLAIKLINTSHDLVLNTGYTAQEKLTYYLKKNAYKHYYSGTLAQLAAQTGLSYRHVTRLIKQMLDQGELIKDEEGYKIFSE